MVYALTHKLHIATLAEVDQKIIHQSVYLPLTIQLALNFKLKQEMQQICYSFVTSLVPNSKPKAWDFQQGLILLVLS